MNSESLDAFCCPNQICVPLTPAFFRPSVWQVYVMQMQSTCREFPVCVAVRSVWGDRKPQLQIDVSRSSESAHATQLVKFPFVSIGVLISAVISEVWWGSGELHEESAREGRLLVYGIAVKILVKEHACVDVGMNIRKTTPQINWNLQTGTSFKRASEQSETWDWTCEALLGSVAEFRRWRDRNHQVVYSTIRNPTFFWSCSINTFQVSWNLGWHSFRGCDAAQRQSLEVHQSVSFSLVSIVIKMHSKQLLDRFIRAICTDNIFPWHMISKDASQG